MRGKNITGTVQNYSYNTTGVFYLTLYKKEKDQRRRKDMITIIKEGFINLMKNCRHQQKFYSGV